MENIFFGDTVKALGDGKVVGYLVRFSNQEMPDLEDDFFTAKTEFGTNTTPPVVYHHGMDSTLKAKIIGTSELKFDELGVWIEAQLNMRDEYERAVYGMVEAGKVGWSSGAISHLYESEETEKARWIKTWVIGEASITPTPAEPLNNVLTLKSFLESGATAESDEGENENKTIEEVKMKPEEKELDLGYDETAETVDVTELVQDAVAEQMKAWEEKQVIDKAGVAAKRVNVNSKTKRGDSETKAFAYFARTGDEGAIKASNDTDMNIGTDADGGYTVPTGHYNGIIAKRDESMLSAKLGVRMIPGTGTTVNVPLDNEADGEFVVTGEGSGFDRDAPALSTVAMTLLKYTKKIELSYELLQDEDSRLMAFLADFVGRGMAKTHNDLLLTEVAANGTQFKEFASATVIAVNELETIPFNSALGNYLDEAGSVGWVMQRPVHGEIVLLDDANTRRYASNTMPDSTGVFAPSLLGYPVHYSAKAGLTAANAKSVFFGNWNFVGKREAPGFTVLRDPYSKAANGQVVLHYYFRTVYDVLQAEAIGYGDHPTA
jgi:HK97 family phage major capsid protein